jgi:low affinity Fe/Cu permease
MSDLTGNVHFFTFQLNVIILENVSGRFTAFSMKMKLVKVELALNIIYAHITMLGKNLLYQGN